MMRLALLILGALAAVVFAAFILVAVPRLRLPTPPAYSPIPPFLASESPLAPYTEIQQRGRKVYQANGCVYCHSQQVRDPTFTNDVERGWGRPSYPSDYIYDSPVFLGTMRTGPDLINVGQRLPDRNWHLVHLYQPRSLVAWSIMPPFPFLFEEKEKPAPGDEVIRIPDPWGPAGRIVVVTEDAKALVAYLLSLQRGFPPPEVKQETERRQGTGRAE